jgi:hypothetical protein
VLLSCFPWRGGVPCVLAVSTSDLYDFSQTPAMVRTCNCLATLAATLVLGIVGCKASQPAPVAVLDAETTRTDAAAANVGMDGWTAAPSATIFDLFAPVFAEKAIPPYRGDTYRLYYLSGPGGSRPVMIQCRVGPDGAEVLVNKAIGTLGRPETWSRGSDSRRRLSAQETEDVRRLAQTFVDQVRNGSYMDNEFEWMDGAMVATEVSQAGETARVVRADPNDGSQLSAFEKKLFVLAAGGFDGGIPSVRLRLSKP